MKAIKQLFKGEIPRGGCIDQTKVRNNFFILEARTIEELLNPSPVGWRKGV